MTVPYRIFFWVLWPPFRARIWTDSLIGPTQRKNRSDKSTKPVILRPPLFLPCFFFPFYHRPGVLHSRLSPRARGTIAESVLPFPFGFSTARLPSFHIPPGECHSSSPQCIRCLFFSHGNPLASSDFHPPPGSLSIGFPSPFSLFFSSFRFCWDIVLSAARP